jgi:cell division protein FtsB
MYNKIGAIFVFAVLIMSVVFMSFAVAIFSSHTNWQEKAKQLDQELQEMTAQRDNKEATITKLNEDIAASVAARDKVVAALQAALVEKNTELFKTRGTKSSASLMPTLPTWPRPSRSETRLSSRS